MRCLAAAALLTLVVTALPSAEPSILWQTSFDCPREWKQSDGLGEGAVCAENDLISGHGGWVTANGSQDQIIAEANHPSGTGLGFRHWRGKGSSNNGGGIRIDVPSKPSEVWVRWYMRYSKGVRWDFLLQTKDLYVNVGQTSMSFTMGFHDGLSPGTFGVGVVNSSQTLFGRPGWSVAKDGEWHFYEFHVKTTAPTVAESWIDGKRTHRDTKAEFRGVPISHILVGSNHCCTLEAPDFYNDFDDIAISTTGYIGPIGGTAAAAPRPETR